MWTEHGPLSTEKHFKKIAGNSSYEIYNKFFTVEKRVNSTLEVFPTN